MDYALVGIIGDSVQEGLGCIFAVVISLFMLLCYAHVHLCPQIPLRK